MIPNICIHDSIILYKSSELHCSLYYDLDMLITI